MVARPAGIKEARMNKARTKILLWTTALFLSGLALTTPAFAGHRGCYRGQRVGRRPDRFAQPVGPRPTEVVEVSETVAVVDDAQPLRRRIAEGPRLHERRDRMRVAADPLDQVMHVLDIASAPPEGQERIGEREARIVEQRRRRRFRRVAGSVAQAQGEPDDAVRRTFDLGD